MTPLNLMVITGSTRPNRCGAAVGEWAAERARAIPSFAVEAVDLEDLDLPWLDEPRIPRLGDYVMAHTRSWAARVERADAFVFVTPEYNLAPPPPLLNAIDFLFAEWQWKAAGIVSYGGAPGGVRAAQVLKHVLGALSVFTVHEAVAIQQVENQVVDGVLTPPTSAETSASARFGRLEHLAADLRRGRRGRRSTPTDRRP